MDINKDYSPLPVFNQGQRPDCVLEVRANFINAFMRIFFARATNWTVDQAGHWSQTDGCNYSVATPDKLVHTTTNGTCGRGWTAPQTPAAFYALLKKHHVLEIGVPSRVKSFSTAWGRRQNGKLLMPVIDYVGEMGNLVVDHDTLVVGYRKNGLIIQNSWGRSWGKHGRAIITWDFIFKYGCSVIPYTFDGKPA